MPPRRGIRRDLHSHAFSVEAVLGGWRYVDRDMVLVRLVAGAGAKAVLARELETGPAAGRGHRNFMGTAFPVAPAVEAAPHVMVSQVVILVGFVSNGRGCFQRDAALSIAAKSLSRDPSEDQRDHVHAQPEAGFDEVPGMTVRCACPRGMANRGQAPNARNRGNCPQPGAPRPRAGRRIPASCAGRCSAPRTTWMPGLPSSRCARRRQRSPGPEDVSRSRSLSGAFRTAWLPRRCPPPTTVPIPPAFPAGDRSDSSVMHDGSAVAGPPRGPAGTIRTL